MGEARLIHRTYRGRDAGYFAAGRCEAVKAVFFARQNSLKAALARRPAIGIRSGRHLAAASAPCTRTSAARSNSITDALSYA
ncbi:hypothetical protein KCP69_18660 [Salmonella enterica subsp. enterica]|nr:hypothetical protein KCP69_18660 [Salmonella enterica subsp. enterica]